MFHESWNALQFFHSCKKSKILFSFFKQDDTMSGVPLQICCSFSILSKNALAPQTIRKICLQHPKVPGLCFVLLISAQIQFSIHAKNIFLYQEYTGQHKCSEPTLHQVPNMSMKMFTIVSTLACFFFKLIFVELQL